MSEFGTATEILRPVDAHDAHDLVATKLYKVYLSGAMSGIQAFNFPAFDSLAEYLRIHRKWEVVSPAEHDRDMYPGIKNWTGFATGDVKACPLFDLESAMQWDMTQVMACDAIVMLPGWEKSRGAKRERANAEWGGKEVWLACENPAYGLPEAAQWLIVKDSAQQRMAEPLRQCDHDVLVNAGLSFKSPVSPGGETHGTGEIRMIDPQTGAAKGQKLQRFDLMPPIPLREIAEVYGRGALKYEARNWEKGYAWSLSYGACQRHLTAYWSGQDIDPESGQLHLAHAGFHILAMLEYRRTHPEKDDRSPCNTTQLTGNTTHTEKA